MPALRGAHDIGAIDPRVHRIMDLKTPSSGEVARNRVANLELLGPRDEVKFVIGSEEDYAWAAAKVPFLQKEIPASNS